jgi:DNA uptake protein ComE-like DNA-binding protein
MRLTDLLNPNRSRFHDPYYRLRSLQEVQVAARQGVRIDVNQATVDDWLRLPGLSIHQARSLVALRSSGVAFHCIDDIAAALGLPIQRVQPLVPILQFCFYEDEPNLLLPQIVEVNVASAEQLLSVPGIEPELVRWIVSDRQQNGTYRTLVDLQRRLGLSAELMGQLMHYLRV